MQTVQQKIKKLLLAVDIKNDGKLIYLFSRKQIFSAAKNRTYNLRILSVVLKTQEWNRIFPNYKKDPLRYKKEVVQADVYSGFKDIEILLLLADILKNGNQKAFSLVEENMM